MIKLSPAAPRGASTAPLTSTMATPAPRKSPAGPMLLTGLLLAACQAMDFTIPDAAAAGGKGPEASAAVVTRVQAVLTEAVSGGKPSSAAFWAEPATPGVLRVIAASGEGGLQLFSIDGRKLGQHDDIEASLVDVLHGFYPQTPLILVYDRRHSTLQPFVLDNASGRFEAVAGDTISIEDELTGLCSYQSTLSGNWYVYGVTDAGLVLHWELYLQDARVAARLLRSVPVGKGNGFCAVDPTGAMLYLSDEELGVFRLGAEPERDTTRQVVDLVEPYGRLGDDLKGLGVYRVNDQLAYLVLADAGAGLLRVYELPDGTYRGAVAIDGLSEPEGLAATALATGALAVADEDDSDGASELKLIRWQALAAPLALATASGEPSTRRRAAVVTAVGETDAVDTYGDAADDPAIWVHPVDPTLSLILGTEKQLGLHVYDLAGRTLQTLPDGRLNNVDVRDNFALGETRVSLAVASNRSHNSLSIYRIDADQRRLVNVSDGVVDAQVIDPYGLCLYQSRTDGHTYAFVNESGSGRFVQFRLIATADGLVNAQAVREFTVGSQSEGCVADDEAAVLYVAEEDFGIYRYGAEPDAGDERTLIDSVDSGRLTADIEGVALWLGEHGRGYLVASNQGADNFVLYRREGDNSYVGTVHVIADASRGLDGVSETDGIDVTSAALGPAFPDGLLVAQDGRNITPNQRQNFKLVSWRDIADALELTGK